MRVCAELSSVNPIVSDDGALSITRPSDLGPASAVQNSGREVVGLLELKRAVHLMREKEQAEARARELSSDLAIAKMTIRQLEQRQVSVRPICVEKVCDGVMQCGHQLCGSCFYIWYHSSRMAAKFCPVCRAILDDRHGKAFIKIYGTN